MFGKIKIRIPVKERLENLLMPITESGCLIFMGAWQGGEYGFFYIGKKCELAHKVSWKLYRGPIPNGMMFLHKCDFPSFCNPQHLWLVNNTDNQLDC